MTNNLEKRVSWSNRFCLWVVVTMAFVAPLCWWSLRQIRLENESHQWVSESDAERQATAWTHERFQIEDRILLTWDGSSINDPRFGKLVEQLAGNSDSNGVHRGGLPYVRSVVDPRPLLNAMQKNEVRPQETVRRLEGTLLGAGTMKIRLTENSRSALKKSKRELQTSFKAKFGQNLEILEPALDLTSLVSIPAPAEDGTTSSDPSPPAVMSYDGTFSDKTSLNHDLQVSWKGMHPGNEMTIEVARWMTTFVPERNGGQPIVESCFFAPGSPAALEIELSDAGIADQSEAVAAIRGCCERVGIPNDNIRMSGQAVAEARLNQDTLKAIWDTSAPLLQINERSVILSSILAMFVVALAFIRNLRLTTMVVIVSLFVLCATAAIIPLARSTVNQYLIVLPTVLVGITITGARQVCSRWKQAGTARESLSISLLIGESRSGRFLAIAAVSLCTITLCLAKKSPLWDIGIYGTVGSIIAFAMIVFGLPSLIQVWNIKPVKATPPEDAVWRSLGQSLTMSPGWNSLALLAICVGFGYFGRTMLTIDTKPYREWSEDSKIAQDYRTLENELAGTMSVATVVRFDQLAQTDTNFLDRMEVVRNVEEKLRQQSAVTGCLSLADFQPMTERPAEDAGFSQRTKYNRRASGVQQKIVDGEIPFSRSFYAAGEQASNAKVKSDLASLSQPGDELWRISARIRAVSNNDLTSVLNDLHRTVKGELKLQPGSNYVIAGDLPQFVKQTESLRATLFGSFALSCACTLALVAFAQRNLSSALVTMIPCLAPIALLFGILSFTKWPIDVDLLMTACIALGIMVDGKMCYLDRVKRTLKSEGSRLEAAIDSLTQCGPMMCQNAVVFAAGFLVLAQATAPFIQLFGMMMSALVSVSLLTDLILLPQLVAGPFGWVFETSRMAGPAVAQVMSPEIPVNIQPAPLAPDADAIPSPHIKPHVLPVKKRKTSTRREPDPE